MVQLKEEFLSLNKKENLFDKLSKRLLKNFSMLIICY